VPGIKIKTALENYVPSQNRSQYINYKGGKIILDAYNANPSSMRAAIQNFTQMDFANKVVIIGGMMELGEESILEHQQIIDLLAESNWNHVVLVGGDFENTRHSYTFVNDYLAAKRWMQEKQLQHCAILIKGSRAFTLEKILVD
jgi:UDP-N-acetylmuramoyl-tripeptide--D-alanyl-D-alanine ligase